MRFYSIRFVAAFAILVLPGCGLFQTLGLYTPPPTVDDQIRSLRRDVTQRRFGFDVFPGTRIDSVRVDSVEKRIEIDFNGDLSFLPFRPANVTSIQQAVHRYFAGTLDSFSVSVRTLKLPVESLVPNYFRSDTSAYDRSRIPGTGAVRPLPVVQNVSKPFSPSKGLHNKNIGLWHSHGWYYNNEVGRWEWQRPRLFLTVEDLIPTSFVLPYIVPMLENSAATVFVPRERDLQTNEVIVDNDSPGSGYSETSNKNYPWITGMNPAFGVGTPPYGRGVNPFRQGTFRMIRSDQSTGATVRYAPDIPETADYSVSIAFASIDSGVTNARYSVHHLGGITEFAVNQTIGGGTWIYLGTFRFRKGIHSDSGAVIVASGSLSPGSWLTADAVRFGGGMGVIERNGQTSGRPKFVEGSRYWLQFAGMPDSLVYNFSRDRQDYRDDYMSRAEYLNYLKGAPFGPNKYRSAKGLGIPIDLSLAFHTDAGITNNDTTVGTLSIYTLDGADSSSVFPDGVSRLANRDFADILQTQIVDDVRSLFDPVWNRRQLRNGDYSESRRPNIPSALLELLSHQNFLDMKFMLDPRFRFHVSRAIYKAMLRFLATQDGMSYVVQPLPVTHMRATFAGEGSALLQWKPTMDPLEPTASPTGYIVYTRIGDGGFDNGRITDSSTFTCDILPGIVYGFKVTAVNDGGESFPSEILSCSRLPGGRGPALIVNAFDRVSGPQTIESPDVKGFMPDLDAGVADHVNPGFTGDQHAYERTSQFRTNDAPGHGASYADQEGKPVAGNSFDYPDVHGRALLANGWSFVSVSDEAVMDSLIDLRSYRFVDVILGEEKTTKWQRPAIDTVVGSAFKAFPLAFRNALSAYFQSGGTMFLSGSYIGSELFAEPKQDTLSVQFAKQMLHINWGSDHAARTGRVVAVDTSFVASRAEFIFNTALRPDLYAVEAPDALIPADTAAKQLLRYSENQFGAGVGYRNTYGVVVTGFPFETIPDDSQRTVLMRAILKFLRPGQE